MLKKIKEDDNKEHFYDETWSEAAIVFTVFGITIASGLAFFIVLYVIYFLYKLATKKTTNA